MLFLKVRWFLFKEARLIRQRFPGFIPYERAFNRAYRFYNPFSICKEFLRQKGVEQIDAYGETPLPIFAQIADEFSLSSNDTIAELGCGRGRGVFFLSYLLGSQVIGMDWVPFFIQKAQKVAASVSPQLPVCFCCAPMDAVDFAKITAIYLYGTCLKNEEILRLIKAFKSAPASVKIITVSYPMSDYSSDFYTVKQFTALFPWGEADIYLNKKK